MGQLASFFLDIYESLIKNVALGFKTNQFRAFQSITIFLTSR